jgi:hypothetical protein
LSVTRVPMSRSCAGARTRSWRDFFKANVWVS